MKNRIIKPLLVIFVSILVLTGCKKEKDNPLVGTWDLYRDDKVDQEVYYTFEKDNKGSYTIYGGTRELTYELKDNVIVITYVGDSKSSETDYSIRDDILTIKDGFGDNITFKKR